MTNDNITWMILIIFFFKPDAVIKMHSPFEMAVVHDPLLLAQHFDPLIETKNALLCAQRPHLF